MIEELKSMAAEHWRTWLPKKWEALIESDRLDQALDEAARGAEREMRELMEAGARDYEAREIVLPQWILLQPESNTTGSLELDEELAEMEREYQEQAAKELEIEERAMQEWIEEDQRWIEEDQRWIEEEQRRVKGR